MNDKEYLAREQFRGSGDSTTKNEGCTEKMTLYDELTKERKILLQIAENKGVKENE
ncbi:hypothetical protein [Mahella australiensis]|uniref:Uncharacterized protein n=1 Tax=Mahella australiensis (strain DSM 15567 / CIP 107919 / 50-1 BON) TaxID=697281 RepID=F4A0F3_MAHA5|nr:hypothetical protein [Mahella australiensis]AEE98014.1 hypothetical protein Mahau_2892 [Mahella australiensis 50-1 BON]